MFTSCYSLEELDLSSFDTSNVTTLRHTFSDMHSLKTINVSTFNTAKVTNTEYTFANCRSLKVLDLRSFNTINTTSMCGMFNCCNSLESLDISSFKTQNVEDMSDMFSGCSSLKSLDVTNFDTSNVESMSGMFEECSSLTEIDLHNFDTANVYYMNDMFKYCRKLEKLDLSNFDRTNIKSFYTYIFSGCYRLSSLTIGEKFNNIKYGDWLPNNTTGCAVFGTTDRISGTGLNAYIENTAKTTYTKLPEDILYGDVDLDNTVQYEDAALLLKYLSGLADLDKGQLEAAKITDKTKAMHDILDVIKIIETA